MGGAGGTRSIPSTALSINGRGHGVQRLPLYFLGGESLDVVVRKAWTVGAIFYGCGSGIITSDTKYLIIPLYAMLMMSVPLVSMRRMRWVWPADLLPGV